MMNKKQDGSKHKYIETLITVRDCVHYKLITKNPHKFQHLMMSQNEHLVSALKSNSGCCIKELDLVTPDILSSLAATRYRLLTSVSEYELVNIIARVICELEVDEAMVTEVLFETCMYFYTQKKLMRVLRLSSLEHRLKFKNKEAHAKTLQWVKSQQENMFTADDTDERAFYNRLVS